MREFVINAVLVLWRRILSRCAPINVTHGVIAAFRSREGGRSRRSRKLSLSTVYHGGMLVLCSVEDPSGQLALHRYDQGITLHNRVRRCDYARVCSCDAGAGDPTTAAKPKGGAMEHQAYERSCISCISRVLRRNHSGGARRRNFLTALALAVVLLSAGCGTSAVSSGASARSAASRISASQMAVWLARLFGIASPSWQSGVLAGRTCGDHPTHAFCPYTFATTPDGKVLALASLSGEVRVWDVATHRLLLDEPRITGTSNIGSIGVWLSSDGRLLARAAYNAGIGNPMVIISLQVWDIPAHQPLIQHGPTSSSPLPQIGDVGLAPNGLILVFVTVPGWYLYARSQGGYKELATDQSRESVQSVDYVASRAEWIVNLYGGYAIWKPSATPVIVKVPCHMDSQISTINDQGNLYACATGGPDGPASSGNSALIWDVTRKAESARLEDARHIGNVAALTFLNNGRSVALLAWPGPGNPVVDGPENLLLYSLVPHPAEQSVITLPGLSGGWGIYTIGSFAVAIGQGNGVGYYCCLKAIRQPAS
jgi:hypothetical protein